MRRAEVQGAVGHTEGVGHITTWGQREQNKSGH